MLAGIRTIVPGVARTAVPPIVNVHVPSRTMTSASNGDVCSVSPCPASNAKSVRLPPDVLESTRLAMPPSVGVISALKDSASPAATTWRHATRDGSGGNLCVQVIQALDHRQPDGGR